MRLALPKLFGNMLKSLDSQTSLGSATRGPNQRPARVNWGCGGSGASPVADPSRFCQRTPRSQSAIVLKTSQSPCRRIRDSGLARNVVVFDRLLTRLEAQRVADNIAPRNPSAFGVAWDMIGPAGRFLLGAALALIGASAI
jgi:hypothetical protein